VSARLSEVWAQRHLAQPIWEQRAWESMGPPLKRAVCRCGLSCSRAQEWPARARRTIWLGRLSNRGKTETCRSCEVPPSRNRCQGLATLPTPFPEAHPKLPGRQNLSNEQQPRTIVLSTLSSSKSRPRDRCGLCRWRTLRHCRCYGQKRDDSSRISKHHFRLPRFTLEFRLHESTKTNPS